MPIFSTSAAKRIAATVKRVEAMPVHRGGKGTGPMPANPPQASFWAKITGSAGIAIGVYNQWKYAWTEQERTLTGFQDKPDGRTGTTSVNAALNSLEMTNSETGVQGNSIDHNPSVYPPGWLMRPVRGNAVVRMYIDVATDGTTVCYTFEYANSEEGTC
jgi:hypothetical protein